MHQSVEAKYEQLKSIINGYGQVAIAFSGGVDSSLLLKCALDTLGPGKVLALFARSELLTAAEIDHAVQWPQVNGYGQTMMISAIELRPLTWPQFMTNGENRCYFCKFRIYSFFRATMEHHGFSWLIDGTNLDDLKAHRPGLRAIRELEVRMPLVEAGFDKADVRLASQQLGLATWNHPSSSCLATRIPTGMRITSERLQQVTMLENGMLQLGLVGCRVRLCADSEHEVHLEIRSQDFARLAESEFRMTLFHFFLQHSITKVLLPLSGRL
ncbi:MAG: ATP-dependent sacrificial sulfur transferase LarE [Proteobacteria bacterium]|nr:ATP-dependent sacrificial sulfur transferase LarE [Pseudomonadota bacterium]